MLYWTSAAECLKGAPIRRLVASVDVPLKHSSGNPFGDLVEIDWLGALNDSANEGPMTGGNLPAHGVLHDLGEPLDLCSEPMEYVHTVSRTYHQGLPDTEVGIRPKLQLRPFCVWSSVANATGVRLASGNFQP